MMVTIDNHFVNCAIELWIKSLQTLDEFDFN